MSEWLNGLTKRHAAAGHCWSFPVSSQQAVLVSLNYDHTHSWVLTKRLFLWPWWQTSHLNQGVILSQIMSVPSPCPSFCDCNWPNLTLLFWNTDTQTEPLVLNGAFCIRMSVLAVGEVCTCALSFCWYKPVALNRCAAAPLSQHVYCFLKKYDRCCPYCFTNATLPIIWGDFVWGLLRYKRVCNHLWWLWPFKVILFCEETFEFLTLLGVGLTFWSVRSRSLI